MKERLKTFLLLSLVSISFLFTKKLWIQLPTELSHLLDKKDQVLSASYLLSDMIAPNKYLLNFNSKNHTLVYDDSRYGMWINSRKVLSHLLVSKNIKIEDLSYEEYVKFQDDKSIIFYFPEKVNTYILARAWDVKDSNIIADTMPNIDKIYIYLGSGDPFFVFSYNDNYKIIYDNSADISVLRQELNKIDEKKDYNYYYSMRYYYSMEEALKTKNDIYIPYEIKSGLPRVYVTNQISTLEEDEKKELAVKFFEKDINYITEIVEDNGSYIYIYNQRGLKFNINGTLEYFHPLEVPVKERNLYMSLSAAADFISKKTGAQKGMYLAKVEDINSDNNFGYKLTFRYRVRGIPVILGNREVNEYIQMEVYNNHIRSYKHFARKDNSITTNPIIDGRTILSSLDIIAKNYDLLKSIYISDISSIEEPMDEDIIKEVLSSIEDITLAYYDPCLKDKEERLIAVWAIRIKGKLLAFDAYNGYLVYEK